MTPNQGRDTTVIVAITVVILALISALTILALEHHHVDLKAALGYILGGVGFISNLGLLGLVRRQATSNGVKTEQLTSAVTNGQLSGNIKDAVREIVPEVIKEMGVLTKEQTPIPATFDWIDNINPRPVSLTRDPGTANSAKFTVGG